MGEPLGIRLPYTATMHDAMEHPGFARGCMTAEGGDRMCERHTEGYRGLSCRLPWSLGLWGER